MMNSRHSLAVMSLAGAMALVLAGCETTSSSSSSSAPSIPTPSTPSSSPSTPSIPSPSSPPSQPSASLPSPSSSSPSQPSLPSIPAPPSSTNSSSSSTASTPSPSTAGTPSTASTQGSQQSSGSESAQSGAQTDNAGSTAQSGTQTESGGNTAQTGSSTDGNQSATTQSGGSIAYGSEDDPFGDLSRGREATMTASERRAVLDARLEESYGDFDGMILGERERILADENEAGSDVMSGGRQSGGGSGNETFEGPEGSITVASGPSSPGGFIPGGGSREGDFENENRETFPVPDDIPSGNNDDVVAAQLREAAMTEPDPELREKLWDEYRNYTGIGQ